MQFQFHVKGTGQEEARQLLKDQIDELPLAKAQEKALAKEEKRAERVTQECPISTDLMNAVAGVLGAMNIPDDKQVTLSCHGSLCDACQSSVAITIQVE